MKNSLEGLLDAERTISRWKHFENITLNDRLRNKLRYKKIKSHCKILLEN